MMCCKMFVQLNKIWMNDNNLNYYSRNSPVKNRKQPQKGILKLTLPSKKPYSVQVTARNYSSYGQDKWHPHSEINYSQNSNNNQILIVQGYDDILERVNTEQILIVDGEQDNMMQISHNYGTPGIQEQEQHSEMQEMQEMQEKQQVVDVHADKGIEIRQNNDKYMSKSQAFHNQNQEQDRQIFRIFSFGNQNEVEQFRARITSQQLQLSSQSQLQPKQPLIRRLFSMEGLLPQQQKISASKYSQSISHRDHNHQSFTKENELNRNRNIEKVLSVRSKRSSQSEHNKNQKIEDWQKLMLSFIKKRNSKSNTNIIEIKEQPKEEIIIKDQPQQHQQEQQYNRYQQHKQNKQQSEHYPQSEASMQNEAQVIQTPRQSQEQSAQFKRQQSQVIQNYEYEYEQQIIQTYQDKAKEQQQGEGVHHQTKQQQQNSDNRQVHQIVYEYMLIQNHEPYFNFKQETQQPNRQTQEEQQQPQKQFQYNQSKEQSAREKQSESVKQSDQYNKQQQQQGQNYIKQEHVKQHHSESQQQQQQEEGFKLQSQLQSQTITQKHKQVIQFEQFREERQTEQQHDHIYYHAHSQTSNQPHNTHTSIIQGFGTINQQQQTEQEQQYTPYKNIGNMLLQTIKGLPDGLIPTYLKIYNQLMVKQIKAQKALDHQHKILRMMKILTQLHNRMVSVDDYILNQYSQEKEHRVKINQEIIFSLVRVLARAVEAKK